MRLFSLNCRSLCIAIIMLYHFYSAEAQFDYNAIIPSSPTAAALGEYGSNPVSLYTGTPSITIPLGSIKGSELELPISLSYMARGVKVEDHASWVGTGWSLNCTGAINITKRGFEDGTKPRVHFPLPSGISARHDILVDVSSFNLDPEPDLYSFNFPGYSGNFVLDEAGNAVIGDYKELRIKRDPTTFYKFTITTENGTQYIFDQPENTSFNGSSSTSGTSSMYLSKIISPSGKEIINFSYADEMTKYYSLPRVTKYVKPPNIVVESTSSFAFGVIVTNGKRLTHISTNFGQNIDFNPATTARQDLSVVDPSLAPKALQTVRFFDRDNVTKKTFNFNYETIQVSTLYSQRGTGDPPVDNTTSYSNFRLYLKSVEEVGSNSTKHPPYSFLYAGRTSSNKDLLPSKLSAAQDHWGYFNGANNANLWPGYSGPFGGAYDSRINLPIHCSQYITSVPSLSIQGADREPHAPFMSYGTLVSMTYPTGGKTNFELQPHRYMHDSGSGGPVTKTIQAVAQTYIAGSATELETISSIEMFGSLDNHFSFQFEVSCWDPNTHQPVDCSTSGAQVNFDKFQGNSVALYNSSNQEIIAAKWTPGDGGFWIYKNGLVDAQIGKLVPDASGFITLDINNVVTIPGNYTLKSTKDADSDTDVFGWFYYPQEVQVETEEEAPLGGGLRVSKIENFNENNVSTGAKTYQYGLGVLLDGPNYSTYTFRTTQGNSTWFQKCDAVHGDDPTLYLEINAGSHTQLGYTQGSSIGYTTVIERQTGNGSTQYQYTTGIEYPDNADSESNVITNIWWINDPTANEMLDFTITGGKPAWPFISQDNLDRKRGFLKSIVHKDESGHELKIIENTPKITDISLVHGMRVLPFTPSIDWMYSVYKYSSGFVNIAQTVEHQIQVPATSLKEVVQVTAFSYESPYHKQLTKKQTSASDGSVLSTEYRYPDDYTNISDPDHVVSMMKSNNLHVIGSPIEIRNYKNGNLIGGVLNSPAKHIKSGGGFFVSPKAFFKVKAGIGNPTTQWLQDPTAPDENIFIKDAEFEFDDVSNLIQVLPKDGVNLTFTWESGNPFPVAKTLNATSDNVFYNNFESAGFFDPLINANTGKRFWNSGTYNLSVDGNFSPTMTSGLRMSYWYWDNASWNFSGIVNFNNAITAGTKLDDIRVYPEGARMTTFSYDPFIGVTSIADENSVITTFKYDHFGRLHYVADQYKNIVKQFKYHFRGEQY